MHTTNANSNKTFDKLEIGSGGQTGLRYDTSLLCLVDILYALARGHNIWGM